jgi:predicted AAA+ superfamily ATPase
MYRQAIKQLYHWKNSKNRKPLIIYGARQVGKTWLMEEFGRLNYQKVAYIMMAENSRMRELFEGNSSAADIISGLEAEAGFSFQPGETLIILDEIQEVPKAVSALKFIYEQTPEYHIMVAGSLLGVAHHAGVSFPVGKVNSLTLRPLTFSEFVRAVKSDQLAEVLENRQPKLLSAFHDELNNLLKQYLIVGGMPEVVKSFADNGDYFEARAIQQQIIRDYERDFSKHAPANVVPRIQMVWNSIPSQLARENKKFLYGALKTGARAKDFELAIQWLTDAGLAVKIFRTNSAKAPLKHYEDLSAFKLFLIDVGLLGALSNLEPRLVLEKTNIFTEFKGALTEQFVAEQLLAVGRPLYYFSSDDAKTEVDFMIEIDGRPVPIETKSAANLNSKSLAYFVAKNQIPLAVKLSLKPAKTNPVVQNQPLYLAEYVPFLAKSAV